MLYNANDKKPFKAKDAEEMFLPLEIKPVDVECSRKTEKTEKKAGMKYELVYRSNPTPAHLQKLIGVACYNELIKQTSAHPLFKMLVQENFAHKMSAPDIIYALRKYGTAKKLPEPAVTVVTTNILSDLARNRQLEVEVQYEDRQSEGISQAESRKAMDTWDKSMTDAFNLVTSPATSGIAAKHVPKLASVKLKEVYSHTKSKFTPILPNIIKPAPKPKPLKPSGGGNMSSGGSVPPSAALGGNAPPSAALAGVHRKSSLVGVKGSPHKGEEDVEDSDKRVRMDGMADVARAEAVASAVSQVSCSDCCREVSDYGKLPLGVRLAHRLHRQYFEIPQELDEPGGYTCACERCRGMPIRDYQPLFPCTNFVRREGAKCGECRRAARQQRACGCTCGFLLDP